MSELGRIVGRQVANWVVVNQKAIQRRALLVGRLVVWAGRYKSNQVYAFNDMVMFRSYIALAMEDSPRGLPQPGGAGWTIVANLATGGVDNFPDVAAETAAALNTPVEVVTSAISRWAMKQIEDAVTSVPGLVRWRGWWSSNEAYGDRDLVLYNRSVWLNAGGDGVPNRNGWEWLLSTQSGNAVGMDIVAPVLAFHALVANDDGIMVGVKTGIGSLTADHAASIYAQDHEGVYRPFGANEEVWAGGRVVKNGCRYSNDFSNADWLALNGTVKEGTVSMIGPYGDTEDIMEVSFGSTPFSQLEQNNAFDLLTVSKITSIWVKAKSGTTTFTLYGGSRSPALTAVDSEWRRVSHAGSGTNPKVYIENNASGTTGNLYISRIMAEVSTGRTDLTTPSEYIDTGASAVQKVFAHANGNSVINNVVTEARGVDFAQVPRLQDTPSATNDLTRSRDLTDAAWSKLDSVTSYDQIGLDGHPNSASLLIDDNFGGSGIVRVFRSVSVVSGETNCIVLWAKKDQLDWVYLQIANLDTSPYAYFDLTNGVVGTTNADSPEIIAKANNWFKCIFQFTTVTALSGELRIWLADKDGDVNVPRDGTSSIIVGNVEIHKNKDVPQVRALPPIFTEGVSVSIDQTVYSADGANHSQTNYGYSFYWTPTYNTVEVADKRELLSLADGANLSYYDGANGEVESTDGTNTISAVQSVVPGTTYQISIAIGQAGMNRLAIAVDDGPWQEGPYDGAFDVGTLLQMFRNHGYVGYMHDLQGWSGSYESTKQQLDTLRGA